MATAPKRRSWPRWLIGAVLVVAVLIVGGPFVYFHFIEGPAPAKLSLSTTTTPKITTNGTRAPLAGTWKIATGSTAGYRIRETLFGQHSTAVGRTQAVTGAITIAGTDLTTASFTVDMTKVASDRSVRDSQFQGRIMDTSTYPTATFMLTTPIKLAPVPKDRVIVSYAATGRLTLHGTTKTVTIPLTAKRIGNVIEVPGILSVTFSDYHINDPSGGPANVGNAGQMEFLLVLQPT